MNKPIVTPSQLQGTLDMAYLPWGAFDMTVALTRFQSTLYVSNATTGWQSALDMAGETI